MRRFVLALAISALAVVPIAGYAGEQAASDQEIAQKIAASLSGSGQLKGYSIAVKYKDGTARLEGWVRNAQQMSQAVEITRQAPEVSNVVNQLTIRQEPAVHRATPGKPQTFQEVSTSAPISAAPETQTSSVAEQAQQAPAQPQTVESRPVRYSAVRQQAPESEAANPATLAAASEPQPTFDESPAPQQRYARRMRTSAQPAQHYAPRQSRPAATETGYLPPPVGAPTVPEGVETMSQPVQPSQPSRQVAMAPRQPVRTAMRVRNAQPQTMQPPVGPSPAGPPQGAPMPAYVPGTGGGVAPAAYDQPYLPAYAWPGYAAYPNYAAVTYPRQYSPAAWPYIGPFYPYPQVPLGWRKVTLEWDDGWWFLNFQDDRHHCCCSGY